MNQIWACFILGQTRLRKFEYAGLQVWARSGSGTALGQVQEFGLGCENGSGCGMGLGLSYRVGLRVGRV